MYWIKSLCYILFFIPLLSRALEPNFEDIKERFKEKGSHCLQAVITINDCNKKLMKSEKQVSDFMKQIYHIVFKNKFSFLMWKTEKYSSEYYSYSIIKDDDLNSVFFNFDYKKRTIFIDIYSKNLYNPYVVGFFALNWFNGTDMKFDVFLEDEKYEYKIRNRLKCYD
jgi:hypothetical protein